MKKIIQWGLRKNIRGFGYLVRIFFSDGRIVTETKYGSCIYANPYEKIDNSVIRFGYFDEDVYETINQNIRPYDTFWDIGANIGLHSITLKKNYPNLNCLAFEPFPKASEQFLMNCNLNNLKIPLYSFALDRGKGIKNLYTSSYNLGSTGFSEFMPSWGMKTSIYVATYSIDQLIAEFKLANPDIMKIDTEGNEINILKGAEQLLKSGNCRCIIFEANREIDQIVDLLESFSYEVVRLGEAPNYCAKII